MGCLTPAGTEETALPAGSRRALPAPSKTCWGRERERRCREGGRGDAGREGEEMSKKRSRGGKTDKERRKERSESEWEEDGVIEEGGQRQILPSITNN